MKLPEFPFVLTPSESMLVLGVVALLALITLVWNIVLSRRITRLTAGQTGASLERIIKDLHDNRSGVARELARLEQHISSLDARLGTSIRAVETVRFNPFRGDGSGGNQSFATALVDEHGSGVVLLGLYGRERVSVYAKPLTGFASDYELSEEEEKAIAEARSRLKDDK